MKCQSLFSEKKNKKKYFKLSSAEFAQKVVKIKTWYSSFINTLSCNQLCIFRKTLRSKSGCFFSNEKVLIFFWFFHENMLWVLLRSVSVLLMSTQNICFRGEISKKEQSLLSGATHWIHYDFYQIHAVLRTIALINHINKTFIQNMVSWWLWRFCVLHPFQHYLSHIRKMDGW